MAIKIENTLVTFGQKISAIAVLPTEKQARTALFLAGLLLLASGLCVDATAQFSGDASVINYDDDRIVDPYSAIMMYLEGSFGALVMAVAGFGSLLAAVLRRYRTALLLLGLAVGTFMTRVYVNQSFNTMGISQEDVPVEVYSEPTEVAIAPETLAYQVRSSCKEEFQNRFNEARCHLCFSRARDERVKLINTLIQLKRLDRQALGDFKNRLDSEERKVCNPSISR